MSLKLSNEKFQLIKGICLSRTWRWLCWQKCTKLLSLWNFLPLTKKTWVWVGKSNPPQNSKWVGESNPPQNSKWVGESNPAKLKMGWRIQSPAKLKMSWRIQSPAKLKIGLRIQSPQNSLTCYSLITHMDGRLRNRAFCNLKGTYCKRIDNIVHNIVYYCFYKNNIVAYCLQYLKTINNNNKQ